MLRCEGLSAYHSDRRWEDRERVVLSRCSSLIMSGVVSQWSVKEFDHLVAAEDISFHHIALALAPAFTMFVQACLDVLLPVEDSSLEDSMKRFPRAERALNSGPVDHALFEYVSLRIRVEMEIYWTRKYCLIF